MDREHIDKGSKRPALGGSQEEFPQDEMMQEVHFVRLVHFLQTKDLTPEERVKFFGQKEKADSIS